MTATTPRRLAGSIIIRRYLDAFTGTPLVDVPLSRGRHATLDAADFDHLTADCGFTPAWQVNSDGKGKDYVRCTVSGLPKNGNIVVARLVTKARRGQVVRYRDGNPLNLRRENLAIEGGYATARTYAAVDDAEWFGTSAAGA